MDFHEEFEDAAFLPQFQDLYPGSDPRVRLRVRAQLTTAAMRVRTEGRLRQVDRTRFHRTPMALPHSLRTFALAAVLAVAAASAGLVAPFLTNYFASSIPFSSGAGGGQVATTATGQPVPTHPELNHPAVAASVVSHDMRAWGFGHFLPDLWEVRAAPCARSCWGGYLGPARSATESGEGTLGRPSLAS
jgi:hypothetical protein